MTDSRNARLQVQVLYLPTPDARLAREQVQVLSQVPAPNARLARATVQVMTSTARFGRPLVRTVGSSRPLLWKNPSGVWEEVRALP